MINSAAEYNVSKINLLNFNTNISIKLKTRSIDTQKILSNFLFNKQIPYRIQPETNLVNCNKLMAQRQNIK